MDREMRIDANRVKALRETRGWSQEHLAAVAGLSPRTIQRLEAEGKASGETRMAVASALGVGPVELTEHQIHGGPSAGNGVTPGVNLEKIALWAVLLVMMVVVFGYKIGKDMAERDSRASTGCTAESAGCAK